MVKSYTTEAIIINRFNYGEADKVLTLFTKNQGKVTAIAKGLRKPQSKRKGHLELFNHIKAQFIPSHTWDIITEVETINSFVQPETRNQKLETISHAYHYAELIDRLLPLHELHVDVFDLLAKTLHTISSAPAGAREIPNDFSNSDSDNTASLQTIDRYFKHRLIRSLGFWPHDHTVPTDINTFIDSLLSYPLKTTHLYSQPLMS